METTEKSIHAEILHAAGSEKSSGAINHAIDLIRLAKHALIEAQSGIVLMQAAQADAIPRGDSVEQRAWMIAGRAQTIQEMQNALEGIRGKA